MSSSIVRRRPILRKLRQVVFASAALLLLACTSGDQQPNSNVPMCANSYTDCGGTCADLTADERNCGTCGTPCEGDQTCQNGICAGATASGGSGSGTGGDLGTGGVISTGGSGSSYSTEVVLEEGEIGQCEADGVVESTHVGFSGTGYINADNLMGASIEWAVTVGEAGTYSLDFAYASESAADRPADVLVGDTIAASGVSFPSTTAWTNYLRTQVQVPLAAGENRIILRAVDASGLANIDSLEVSGAAVNALDCRGSAGTGGTSPGAGGTPPGTGGSSPGSGYPLGNPAVPSAGCGKSPALSSGTHSMTSATLDREYILSIPENYDPDAPHRLVFGMHWLGGSAEAVQGWSKWFGLKALDTTGSTIFVAPQGYTNGSPWRGDDRDHIFFDELYAALASDLCIDTSRVFSVGFSFGAMFTNSLAQTHQDVLRGVIVYATADYNIYFPENTGKPLAYMGVHGLGDPTCPIDAGRRSKDRFVENNDCTAPSSVPEAAKGSEHVVFDYECPANYPVRWVTFDGKHTYPPNDTGTWVHGETWEFITQF